MFFNTLFFWLANASAIIGLITAAWAGYTGWRFRREKHKISERLQAFSIQKSGSPVAIAIGLGPAIGNIEAVVSKSLAERGMNIPIVPISDTARITEGKADEVVDRLLEVRRILNEKGVTQVHLFYGGPVFVGPALGAALSNWVPTIIYHFQGGTYRPMMRLGKYQVDAVGDTGAAPPALPEEK